MIMGEEDEYIPSVWGYYCHVEGKKFNDYAYIVDVDGVRLDECIAMRDFRVQNNVFTGEDGGTSESRKRTVGEIVIAWILSSEWHIIAVCMNVVAIWKKYTHIVCVCVFCFNNFV